MREKYVFLIQKYIFKVSRFEKFQTITQNRILFIIYIGIISKVLK